MGRSQGACPRSYQDGGVRRTRLQADLDKTRAWQARSRRKLPARSRRAEAEAAERRETADAVIAAAGGRCVLAGVPGAGRCFGRPTRHHVRKQSQGGRHDEDNGVCMCAWHNDQIEADPELARLAHSLGYVRYRGE